MYLKEKENVKTAADLQNLVTSVILRQTDEFTLDDIMHAANLRLVGSSYYASEELAKRCNDTLETLFLIGSISNATKGRYRLCMSWPAVSTR